MQDKVLELLRKQNDYVSGELLSQKLKISRAGVWKRIAQLRRKGYEIEAVSHHGYHLTKVPDKLYPDEIRAGLQTQMMGRQIYHFEELPSTMDFAIQVGLDGAPEGTLVCAEGQTAGRGRLGRKWVSPKKGGLYCSLIIRPDVSLNEISTVTLMAAVSVCEALRETVGVDAKIKWPNDVLVGGKKIAGILTEMNADMDRIRFLVLGLGVNVNTSSKQLLKTATSLRKESGRVLSRVMVLQTVLQKIEFWYNVFMRDGQSEVLQRWRQLSMTLGQPIIWKDQSGELTGKAVGIDETGGLLIEQENGMVIKRMSGEVVLK